MKTTTATLLPVLLLLPATAAEKPAAPNLIITPEQGEVLALHQKNETLAAHDRNENGQIDRAEAASFLAAYNKKLAEDRQVIRDDFHDNALDAGRDPSASLPLVDYKALALSPEEQVTKTPKVFRLRASVDDFSQPVDKRNPVSALNPAQFSFTRDYRNDADEWAAKGAIGGYWNKDMWHWSAGVEFERLATDIPGNEDVDLLALKVLGGGLTTKIKPFGSLLWDAGASYTTNFDFDGALLGANLQIEPAFNHPIYTVWSLRGVGNGISAGNSIALKLRHFLRVEGGGTVDDFPGQPEVDDDYLRAGGHVEAAVWPFGTRGRLRFTGAYSYYAELLGDGPDYHNFAAGVEWRLDDQGHFVLGASYNIGHVPMLLTERETLLLTLGVRF